jgi:hypothetical protein
MVFGMAAFRGGLNHICDFQISEKPIYLQVPPKPEKSMSLVLASLLAVANAAPPSPLEFTWKLQKESSAGLDKALLGFSRKTTEEADFRAGTAWWCPRNHGVRSLSDVVAEYGRYCRSRGGVFEDASRDALGNFYCRESDRSDRVIFLLRARDSHQCSTVQTASVVVVEPRVSPSAPGYLDAIAALGYRSRMRREADDAQKLAEASRRVLAEEERLSRERPAKRQLGTAVCRVEGGIRYAGWVERVEAERIQIRVGSAVLANAPSVSPSGWQPQIIWAPIDAWSLC